MVIDQMAAVVEGRLATFARWARRHRWLNGDIIASGLSLVLSAYFLSASARLGLFNGQQAAPGTFPALISAGLVVCSIIWLTGALLKLRSTRAFSTVTVVTPMAGDPASDTSAGDSATSETANWRVVFVVVWSALLLPSTEWIGMVPMLFIYLVGLYAIIARASIWKSALVIAVVLALFAWGAYEGRIYLPDPLRIGRTLHELLSGLLG